MHIYAGWFAYVAGLFQCNSGLGMMMSSDQLVFAFSDVNLMVSSLCVRACAVWLVSRTHKAYAYYGAAI